MEGGVTCVAVNGSSTSAIVGGADGQIRIVNLNNGQVVQNLEGHNAGPSTTAKTVLNGSLNNTQQGQQPATQAAEDEQEEEETSVERVEWAPTATSANGLWISVGTDKRVKVFEGGNGSLRWSGQHGGAVTSLVLHPAPNAHLFTTGSTDRTLRTWDLRTGNVVRQHTGHRDVVHVVAVSADGKKLVSGSDDGTARVFDA